MKPGSSRNGLTPHRTIPQRSRQPNNYQPMRTLETSADQFLVEQKNVYKQYKSNALDKMAKEEYQPAMFAKAMRYRNERSYMKKIDNTYKQMDLLADTEELKYFGVGLYFYIQFIRRLCWFFLFASLVQGICIYINYNGIGLNNYSLSFSSYLIKTTIGNYSGPIISTTIDPYLVGLAPAVTFLALFLFYIIWKVHVFRIIALQEEDNKDVKPQKFCIEFNGLPKDYVYQEDLQRFFTAFGPVYEVSVVRNFEDNLGYFHQMDQLQQQIKEEQLELTMGGDASNRKQIAKKKDEKGKLQKKLNSMIIKPTSVSAFVHFQFQKSKVECLSYFNDHYLFDTCSHSCTRTCCCCCINQPDERAIFNNRKLFVSNQRPPPPEDINWESYQLGICGTIIRFFFSVLIILLFLALSCTIIGICGVYISSHSHNCDNTDLSIYTSTTITATGDTNLIRCYCNANLVASFTDSSIKNTCSTYLNDIYVQQTIQYVILITAAITNVLFGLIVDKLVNCMRPSSKVNGLYLKTIIFTIFLIFNSVLIPVLIYADIFGFQATSYVSFLTIISTDIINFLSVTNLSFYPSFTQVWYRNVSPLFTNYVIFNTVAIWLVYIFYRCCCISKDQLQEDQRKVLQKTMNRKITDFTVQVYKEASNLYLIVIMALLLSAGIPAMLPLAFINIISRYLTNRSLIQSYSSKIDGLGQEFNSVTLQLLPFMLILFPLVGCWMLISNSFLYPTGLPTTFTFLDFLKGNFQQLDKQLYLPFYFIISVVSVLQFVIYHSVIKFCSCLCSMCYQKKEINYHTRPFSQYSKSINVHCSYNIRNNDQFRNAILHLEKYLIAKE